MFKFNGKNFEEIDADNEDFLKEVEKFVIPVTDEEEKEELLSKVNDCYDGLSYDYTYFTDLNLSGVIDYVLPLYSDDDYIEKCLKAIESNSWFSGGDEINIYKVDGMHIIEVLLFR